MRVSWGRGIAIFYVCFMVIIVATVIYAAGFGLNMESDNYYAEEQVYQNIIDKKINANSLKKKPVISKKGAALSINFGEPNVTGNVTFFRQSDSNLDRKYDINTEIDSILTIDLAGLKPGKWKIKLDWAVRDNEYYIEEIVFF